MHCETGVSLTVYFGIDLLMCCWKCMLVFLLLLQLNVKQTKISLSPTTWWRRQRTLHVICLYARQIRHQSAAFILLWKGVAPRWFHEIQMVARNFMLRFISLSKNRGATSFTQNVASSARQWHRVTEMRELMSRSYQHYFGCEMKKVQQLFSYSSELYPLQALDF